MSESWGNPSNFGGADDSTNYLAYPTLMALPRQPKPARQTVAELEAELLRLQARAAEYQQLLAQIQAREEALMAQLAQERAQRNRDGRCRNF